MVDTARQVFILERNVDLLDVKFFSIIIRNNDYIYQKVSNSRIRKVCSNEILNRSNRKIFLQILKKKRKEKSIRKNLSELEIKRRLNLKIEFKTIFDFRLKIHTGKKNNISSIFLLQKISNILARGCNLINLSQFGITGIRRSFSQLRVNLPSTHIPINRNLTA